MKPKNNWAMVVTQAGDEPEEFPRADPQLGSRLEVLAQKWKNRNPDTEVSVVTRGGDRIYMGRFYEGVVIRLNGNEDECVFLTTEMARQFGEWLIGQNS